jgi:hypothetical protein
MIIIGHISLKLIIRECHGVVPDPDPHQSGKLDPNPDPDPHQCAEDKPKNMD